jgi:hypothetical protein
MLSRRAGRYCRRVGLALAIAAAFGLVNGLITLRTALRHSIVYHDAGNALHHPLVRAHHLRQ